MVAAALNVTRLCGVGGCIVGTIAGPIGQNAVGEVVTVPARKPLMVVVVPPVCPGCGASRCTGDQNWGEEHGQNRQTRVA